MPNIKRANTSGITKSGTAISDVPDAPTIGTATDAGTGGAVSVTFTPAATGGAPTSYTATSNPGSITGTGSSPITVTGLTNGTSYTFTVTATNSTGTSPASAASNSASPTAPFGMYESISTTSVGAGGASSVTFSSIPSTYTHLQIRATVLQTSADNFYAQFNSDTGANYSWHQLTGDGASPGSVGAASTSFMLVGNVNSSSTSYAGVSIIDILDYKDTNKFTTVRTLHGSDSNGSGLLAFRSGNWRNTNAVTSIVLTPSAGTFKQYSHFALYGIKGS